MTTRSVFSMFARPVGLFFCAAAAVAMASAASGAVQSQPVPTDEPLENPPGEVVNFAIEFTEGDVFAYRTRMDLRVEQDTVDGELVEQLLSYDVTTRFWVQGVEDGVATLAMRVTKASISVADGEERAEVEVEAQEEGAEYESALASALANTVVTVVVGPEGEITSVLGAEAYEAALETMEGADPRLLGFLSAAQIADTFEPLFTVEELNGKPRRVGTGWGTSREIDLPPVAVIDLTYAWRVQGVMEGVATLVARVETNVRRPTTPDPARPTVVLEGSEGNVLTQWDSQSKAVTRRISTLRLNTRWALGELEIGQKQQSTLRIERVAVDE